MLNNKQEKAQAKLPDKNDSVFIKERKTKVSPTPKAACFSAEKYWKLPVSFCPLLFLWFSKRASSTIDQFWNCGQQKAIEFPVPQCCIKEVTSAFNPCQVYKTPVIQLSVNLLEFLEINEFSCRVSLHHLLQIKLLKKVLMYRSFNRSDWTKAAESYIR